MKDKHSEHLTDAHIDMLLAGMKDASADAHLQECAMCRKRWQEEERAHALLRSAPWVYAPEGLTERISQQLMHEHTIQPQRMVQNAAVPARPVLWGISFLSFLAIAGLLVGGSLILLNVGTFIGSLRTPFEIFLHISSGTLRVLFGIWNILWGNPRMVGGMFFLLVLVIVMLVGVLSFVRTQVRKRYSMV